MKPHRLVFGLVLAGILVGAAHVSQTTDTVGIKMTRAAERFVGALNQDQKAQATFAFDDKERTRWFFTPQQTRDKKPLRKGLRLEEMTADQKAAAMELVKAGTSADGYVKATTIMSLESILHDLEKNGANVRNPEWYFFSVFGTPSQTGKWGWRVEGHHLSLNFTVDNGKVIGATPAFFGANPAEVKQGDRKGLRTLPEADDVAKELFGTLDEEQKKVAYQEKAFREIEEAVERPGVGAPVGLPAARMTAKQRDVLLKLLAAYTARMPADIGQVEYRQAVDAGVDKIHFAYNGGVQPGEKHSYRVHGPTFVVEFLNIQNDSAGNTANHIHSCWRNMKGDFGIAQ